MKRRHIAALLLSMGIIGSPVMSKAGDLQMAIMSCSSGDSIKVTVDGTEGTWKSSDENIAVFEDNLIKVKAEGTCEFENIMTGFKIKVNASGVSDSSNVIEVNYSSTDSTPVLVEDKTVSIETVESTPNNSTGNYVEDTTGGVTQVVQVVDPILNQYIYQGSIGQSTDVYITNLDTDAVYSSSDPSVATVDESGHVSLVGEGECQIRVDTGNNCTECKIQSIKPYIDDSDLVLKSGNTYQFEVENNFAELPVNYYIVSGSGSVDENGLVTVDNGTVKVGISIGDITYTKSITVSTIHDEYWDAMQPYIEKCLGTPYVFGGETPGMALDCSGYVSYVYGNVGLTSGRYTAQSLYDSCTKTDDPQPGDLVFFTGTYDTDAYITHVGIYAGNGEMYHSGTPNKKSSLNTGYYKAHLVGYGTMISESSRKPVTGGYSTGSAEEFTGEYSQEQMELIWAIVAQECSTGYEGALAVATCAANRAEINYGGYGTDILSQLTAPGQFCYSPSISDPSLWQARLGGNVADFVKSAVSDCLNGTRNHSFMSFRSRQAEGRVCIGGNWYF